MVWLGKLLVYCFNSEDRMDVSEQLTGLREKATKEMEAAMKAGLMDEVIKFARIIKETNDALQNGRLAVERIAAQLEPSFEVRAAVQEACPPVQLPPTSDLPSRKARGKISRDSYLRGLLSKGIHLTRLKGRAFRTSSGKHVGIAYAGERQANKWWMGLPDDHYDVVVFLCETSSGETLDFVLPPDFVNCVWGRLTLSNKQKEWHIERSGPNYELEPTKRLGQINAYRSKIDVLR
jgi:hypothetical protein